MSRMKRFLAVAATILGFTILFVGLGIVLVIAELAIGLPFLLLLMLFYGWMLYAFVHYRQARQEEMLHVLSTAADANLPLAPALWAYLHDRPAGPLREFWVALLLFFVFPGYYWVWHRRHSFDQKASRVAYYLEMGDSLPNALRACPGVVSSDALLTIQVGQHTGRLAQCLRASQPHRLAAIWLELLPRLIYPLIVLLFMSGIISFWIIVLLPKMQRIFAEFDMDMPDATRRVIEFGETMPHFIEASYLFILAMLALVGTLLVSSTIRWYLPGFAFLYRRHARSRVLKVLAVFVDAGVAAPEALGLLADSNALSPVVRRRLDIAQQRSAQGESLADSLRGAGLLPASFVPLVRAAERVNNLAWALTELGETLSERTVRTMRRISQVVSPVTIAAIGALVAFIVIGMFMPLVEVIHRVAEQT